MNHILFLECSPMGNQSLGAQQVAAVLRDGESREHGVSMTTRSLVAEPLAPLTAQYANAITSLAPFDDPALELSERLISELEATDGLLISTPMHNFTVPATLKLWIDHVLRIARSFTVTSEGKVGLLQDRPTLVLVRSGGACVGDTARQPDFLTPYLRHALSTIGIHEVQFLYLAGPYPSSDVLDQVHHALTSFFAPTLDAGTMS
ncbi:FMN-dependent NADH-azoreductase [Ottowia thiooxydans]|uniref:FMN-dependent NADH-azoreductase n=1 Tax=Ottowia thiooxydans TaxID=219182 RepID=UPI00068896E3|nr:NAD(P)H-dependent oxidoreductase [Ottowia thiooxydans]